MKIKRISCWQVDLPLHEGSYKWSGGKSVDVFDATLVADSPPAGDGAASTVWRFDDLPAEAPADTWPATRGWEPLRDVEALAVRGGRLAGTTTSA